MRTYAGHSTARDSNELYRKNLATGQTGLSVAFDLPTQTGNVGVSIAHQGDMHSSQDLCVKPFAHG